MFLGWSDFQKNVTESLQNVRLSTEFSDITLVLDGDNTPVEAHRLVLAAGSTFFQRVLGTKQINHPHLLLYLAGVNPKHLDHILDFLYNGQTKLPHSELHGFLETANNLGIKGLGKDADTEDQNEIPLEVISNDQIHHNIESKDIIGPEQATYETEMESISLAVTEEPVNS